MRKFKPSEQIKAHKRTESTSKTLESKFLLIASEGAAAAIGCWVRGFCGSNFRKLNFPINLGGVWVMRKNFLTY